MLTVMTVVVALIVLPGLSSHNHNRRGPFIDRPIDQLNASHVVDRVVAIIADAGHEMAKS